MNRYYKDLDIAHTLYPENPDKKDLKKIGFSETALSCRNNSLISDNALIDFINTKGKKYLFHVTTNSSSIRKNGDLLPSSGCLVGSIYCVPAFTEEHDTFKIHNLGQYVYENEAPKIAKKYFFKNVSGLLIEVEDKLIDEGVIGIDYLKLGNLHLHIYNDLKHFLSKQEQYQLEKICLDRLDCAKGFLESIADIDEIKSPDVFLRKFKKAQKSLPIFGYVLFEVISEYLMLNQDDYLSRKYAEDKEFNNIHYKKILFETNAKSGFELYKFGSSLDYISEYITGNHVISDFSLKNMKRYIATRLLENIKNKLIIGGREDLPFIKQEYFLPYGFLSLYGHLIHRELRSFGRYPSFYHCFEQNKSLLTWHYWNMKSILTPFNSIIPKGELGINPTYPDLAYKIYQAKMFNKNGYLYAKRGKELNVRIMPKLVDLRYTSMRSTNVKEKNNKKI